MVWQYRQLAAHCCTANLPGRACSICQVCVDRVLCYMQRLQGYAALGVNRFSMGVQSFQQEMLAACGRSHTLTEVSTVGVSMVTSRPGVAALDTRMHLLSTLVFLSCLHVQHSDRFPAGLHSSVQAVRVSFSAASALPFRMLHS